MLNYVTIDEQKAKERFVRDRAKCSEQSRYSDEKLLKANKNRLAELDKLIQSAFEEKVLGNLPDVVCKSLCEKYQAEHEMIEQSIQEIEERLLKISKDDEDAEEYIARLKRYGNCESLTREMCLQLIEFISVGEKSEKDEVRDIQIYYKFINSENLTDFQQNKIKSVPYVT